MITACLVVVLALLTTPPMPGVRAGVPGEKRIRAGPDPGPDAPGWLGVLSAALTPGGSGPDPLDTAADIALFAECLAAGLSTRDAAHLLACTANPAHQRLWEETVALLGIGVGPEKAFTTMTGVDGLRDLAVLAEVSHRSGSAFSQGCHRIADALVASAADHRTAAAERAGVFIALPLAACFLPAFMIIGLAPVVLGLGTKVLGNL
ncbi:bacterial type II secretion system domain protein F [Corynebacterium efficiens YS-314]|uniref:Type II secretion system protein GspF domain-containing protein n=1 Tax=Corynebacterium efficiens (strain DSM 44549 / YS-314 / AJ 12310 / JCM 11189 / NBRC 100395) TaxID=196164 RepID=Q8FST2_COREF|nr:type II secretion system F family protein [Corynebacterium efficiens]EEW50925.1 bacterial type II secretion system domain protein F [Corynebacterium efficiens YS-314]BAC17110.1 conserved hypothetical protein [Corynebacterium efficiens YS-314]